MNEDVKRLSACKFYKGGRGEFKWMRKPTKHTKEVKRILVMNIRVSQLAAHAPHVDGKVITYQNTCNG